MSHIKLNNICKSYQGSGLAVSDFNLDIDGKEFIVFVGPSGCGKSTVLRMIAGLEEITSGELWMDGKLMNYESPGARNVSMVFQNYALYPHMSIYDNLAFSLVIRKIPKKEIKNAVMETAKMLGIDNLLDRKPAQLSGGQRQRVAIGSAILRKPNAFLMDEPLSNLDAKMRTQMRSEIASLYNRFDTTFIYVTHDQTEAMTLGTRIVVLKEGVIQQIDTPKNLYEHPASKFVAGFIGSPSMNFINVRVSPDCSSVSLQTSDIEFHFGENYKEELKKSGYAGKNVIMGIRPNDIYTEDKTSEPHADMSRPFSVDVVSTELLGASQLIYFLLDGVKCVADVAAEAIPEKGEKINLCINMEKIHLFDVDTEETIIG